MTKAVFLSLSCLLLPSTPALADAPVQPETTGDLLNQCSKGLVLATSSLSVNQSLLFALQTIASSSSANQSTKDWASSALTSYGFFKGSYDAANSNSNSVYNSTDAQLQFQEAATLVTSQLDANSVPGYITCVNGVMGLGGVTLSSSNETDNGFTITITYKMMSGIDRPKLDISSDATVDTLRSPKVSPVGSQQTLAFTRINPSLPSTVVVNIMQDSIPRSSASIIIPPHTQVQESITSAVRYSNKPDTLPSEAQCGGGNPLDTTGRTIWYDAAPNEAIDISNVGFVQTPMSVPGFWLPSSQPWGTLDDSTNTIHHVSGRAWCHGAGVDNRSHATITLAIPVTIVTMTYQSPPNQGGIPKVQEMFGVVPTLQKWLDKINALAHPNSGKPAQNTKS